MDHQVFHRKLHNSNFIHQNQIKMEILDQLAHK